MICLLQVCYTSVLYCTVLYYPDLCVAGVLHLGPALGAAAQAHAVAGD